MILQREDLMPLIVLHKSRVGNRLGFFRYWCQIDTFKMVPVPKRCLNRYLYIFFFYQLIIGLAISTKHMGPISQTDKTGLRLTLDYTSLYQKFDYSLFLNLYLPLYLSLLPLLACTYLNNAWDLVLRALPLSVCLSKINRFMHSPIVSRFKSICKMTKCKSKPGLDHSSIMTFK